jgi:hypothetical protein
MWAVWAIVQAREDVEGVSEGEFDYVGYAKCRMQGFRKELKELKETTRGGGRPVEEGERIDRCPNGVGLVEGAIFDF